MSKKETVNKSENEVLEIDSNPRIYEVGYLLIASLPEDQVPGVYDGLKETILGLNGVLVSDEMPKMIDLAYEMEKVTQNVRSKFNNAYFGWVKFEMDSQKVLELKKKLDLDPNFLRFLILKTVKENTIAAKRFIYKDSLKKKPYSAKKDEDAETKGEAVEINKEEIDKEIEALVSA